MKAQSAIGSEGLMATIFPESCGAGGRAVSLTKHWMKLPVWEMRAPLPAQPSPARGVKAEGWLLGSPGGEAVMGKHQVSPQRPTWNSGVRPCLPLRALPYWGRVPEAPRR